MHIIQISIFLPFFVMTYKAIPLIRSFSFILNNLTCIYFLYLLTTSLLSIQISIILKWNNKKISIDRKYISRIQILNNSKCSDFFFTEKLEIRLNNCLMQDCETVTKPGIEPETFPLLKERSTIWAISVRLLVRHIPALCVLNFHPNPHIADLKDESGKFFKPWKIPRN